MSLFDSYGAPTFGLDDAKVAAWSALNSWGTAVDVPSVQLIDVQLETIGGRLEGDDKITATHSRIIAVSGRVRFGSLSFAALEVLTGVSSVESDSTPNRKDTLVLANDKMPYFALCGRTLASEGSGDLHIFLPKIKLMENFGVGMEYGQFLIPELPFAGISGGALWGAWAAVRHETALSVTIPPVTTA